MDLNKAHELIATQIELLQKAQKGLVEAETFKKEAYAWRCAFKKAIQKFEDEEHYYVDDTWLHAEDVFRILKLAKRPADETAKWFPLTQ